MHWLKHGRKNITNINNFNFYQCNYKMTGIEDSKHKKLPQYLHIALAALATVHIGNGTEEIS
jgi:hypothetical protein